MQAFYKEGFQSPRKVLHQVQNAEPRLPEHFFYIKYSEHNLTEICIYL